MKNDEWSVKVSIDKIDSETKQRIKGDAEFKIFEWDTVNQRYIPFGGYNRYKVERQADGTYKVINHSDYAGGSDAFVLHPGATRQVRHRGEPRTQRVLRRLDGRDETRYRRFRSR